MSVDPNSIRNLSNDPAYTEALKAIQTFQTSYSHQGSGDIVIPDCARVYYDPNVPQAAKNALHDLVKNVFTQFMESSKDPETIAMGFQFLDLDNRNYINSQLSP